MNEEKIALTTLCARLERAIHADIGMQRLKTLLYGWKCKYGRVTNAQLQMRRNACGFIYLTSSEVESFSAYAGYDLTQD